jgi:hypothetical protein
MYFHYLKCRWLRPRPPASVIFDPNLRPPVTHVQLRTQLRNKSTNIRQPMLKLKTHSGFHDLFLRVQIR